MGFRRLALVLYDDQRFSAAEATLARGPSGADGSSSLGLADLLLLSKAQARIRLYVGATTLLYVPVYHVCSWQLFLSFREHCLLIIRYQVAVGILF